MNNLENTRDIFNKYAKDYREKYLDQGAYAHVLLEFLKGIPIHGAVLDLGCGPGNISRFLLDHRQDLRLTGMDVAPAMIEEARKLNPGATFQVGNVLDTRGFREGKFDGMVSGFILPYMDTEQVRLHLDQIAGGLHPEGILYLSYLEENQQKSGKVISRNSKGDELFMYYHCSKEIDRLAAQAGFKVDMRDKITPRSENGEPTNNEIIMLLRWS
ncbi:class I SAM-dependent methyltransferase [Robertkochia flava]|uniref:class I SAM-dependent methyltransferase n=1 Tax=Robertkochia flava TaxID=3447986 RepID=UPI001CCE6F80|nr:class I SAM-dependent methyltransferase [Robertkochia marina]